MRRLYPLILGSLLICCVSCGDRHLHAQARIWLKEYRQQLDEFRAEYGGVRELPEVSFFLFGMGNRTKILYKNGVLSNALTHDTLYHWEISEEIIVPSSYCVCLTTAAGEKITVVEDEAGVRILEGRQKKWIEGTHEPVSLPSFKEYKYNLILKVLHQEILVNIVNSEPLPNFFVYRKPWRRDGAMVAMCLEKTGNLSLIKPWVMHLKDPYDRNNAGETEADNLGQTLYLISLFSDVNHPLVPEILKEIKKQQVTEDGKTFLRGRSDFHEAPAYQTKFLKFGLKKLGLKDDYQIPEGMDDYSGLIWWDFKESYPSGNLDARNQKNTMYYPYLDWALDHFHRLKQSPISNRDYPLTWESFASQADYEGMRAIDEAYVLRKTAAPHTWHTAEIFLYVLDN